MKRSLTGFSAAAVTALFVVGCGGSPATSPGATPPPLPSIAIPSVAIPSIEIPSVELPDIDEPHQAPELEALIPTTVAGQSVRVVSLRGAEALQGMSGAVGEALEDANIPAENLAMAVASPANESWVATAISVQGMDPSVLRDAIVAGAPANATQQTIGGKNVIVVLDSQYYYVSGNVLIFILTTDAAVANDFMSQVP